MPENTKNIKKVTKKEKLIMSNKKQDTIKKNEKTKNIIDTSSRFLKYFKIVIFIAVIAIVFYPPYVRGLFFEKEQLPAEIFTFVVFLAFWIYKYLKKDKRFLETPIDYASFGFVIVYLISIAASVSTRLAIAEWLKYCMFFAVFIMLSELADSFKLKLAVMWTIVASAFGVSVIGIDGAAGEHVIRVFNNLFGSLGWDIKFFGIYVGNRINSTLQYPNALGAYLMAVFFVAFSLILMAKRPLTKCIAVVPSFILLATLIFTYSRGVYLVFPIVAVMFFIISPKGSRVKIFLYGFGALSPIAYTIYKLYNIMNSGGADAKTIWQPIIYGVIASIFMTFVVSFILKWVEISLSYFANWIKNLSSKAKTMLAASAGIITLIIIVVTSTLFVVVMNTSVPVILGDPAVKENAVMTITKSVTLESGDYSLEYSLESVDAVSKTDIYTVLIKNKSVKDVVANKSGEILLDIKNNSSAGSKKNKLNFTVPKESIAVSIQFSSNTKSCAGTISDIIVTNINTGKVIKKVIPKYKYVPDRIATMYESMQSELDVVSRNIFYKDAIRLIKDHWLIGAGGGAWSEIYMSHQSYLYFSNQTHNYYLQMAIETGVIGMLVLLLLVASTLIMFISDYIYKREKEFNEGIIRAVLIAGIVGLLVHSVIDFDFSLSAVFLLFWELIAIFNSRYKNEFHNHLEEKNVYKYELLNKSLEKLKRIGDVKKVGIMPILGIIITGVVMMFPIMFNSASNYSVKANQALEKKDLVTALENLENAISRDKFKIKYKTEYAKLILSKDERTQEEVNKSNKYISDVEKVVKYDAQGAIDAGSYYLSTGEIDRGLKLFDEANMLRPLFPTQWQQRIDAYSKVAMYFLQNNDLKNFVVYADKALKIADEAKEVNKNNLNPFVFTDDTMNLLENLISIKATIAVNKHFGGSLPVFQNIPWLDIDSNGIPDQWTVIGDAKAKFDLNKDKMIIENIDSDKTCAIQSRKLMLKEGKSYVVQVELVNVSDLKTIPFASTSKSEITGELRPLGNTFSAKVIAGKLEKDDTYVLKLWIKGKYEVKGIIIQEIQ